MASRALTRTQSCCQSPVGLHEIFDFNLHALVAEFREREELPNVWICVDLPSGVRDWEGLRKALAEEGMEIEQRDDTLRVSGYAFRNDYNCQREIRATVARHRRGSKSFS